MNIPYNNGNLIYFVQICPGAMRSFAVFCLLVACPCLLKGQTANSNTTTPVVQLQPGTNMPAGFPVYKDTGNLNADRDAYSEAKRSWIAAHEQEYRQMMTNANPESVSETIDAAKGKIMQTTNLQAAPQAEINIAQPDVIMPKDFPVMKNTGNMEQDIENYSREKDEWIKNNPDKYLQLTKPQRP